MPDNRITSDQPWLGRQGRLRQMLEQSNWIPRFQPMTPGMSSAEAATGVPMHAPRSLEQYMFGGGPDYSTPQFAPRSPVRPQVSGESPSRYTSPLSTQVGWGAQPSIGGDQWQMPAGFQGTPSRGTPALGEVELRRQPSLLDQALAARSAGVSTRVGWGAQPSIGGDQWQMPAGFQGTPSASSPLSEWRGPSNPEYRQEAGLRGLTDRINDIRSFNDLPGMAADRRQRQQELLSGQWAQRNMEAQYGGQNAYASPLTNFAGKPGGIETRMTDAESAYMRGTSGFRYGQGGAVGRGMLDRFGVGSPLTQPGSTAQIASSGPYMQVGGYGAPLTPLAAPRPVDMQRQYEAMRQGMVMPQEDPDLQGMARLNTKYSGPYLRPQKDGGFAYTSRQQALRDAGFTEQANAIQDEINERKADVAARRGALGLPVGPAQRLAARTAEREATLAKNQARNLQRQGVSPLSSTGQSLAPELYGRMQQQRQALRTGSAVAGGTGSPLSVAVPGADGTVANVQLTQPMKAGASLSPMGVDQATRGAAAVVSASPLLKAAGISNNEDGTPPTANEFASGVHSYFANNPGIQPAEGDLLAMHQLAVQYGNLASSSGETSPFSSMTFSGPTAEMWKELSQLPLDKPNERKAWWGRYQKHVAARTSQPSGLSAYTNTPDYYEPSVYTW